MTAPVVVSGQPGVGKSTICGRLALGRDAAAHVKADDLQRMVVTGGEWPSSGTPAARRQLLARTGGAAHVAHQLSIAGIQPFVDEVVTLPEQLATIDAVIGPAHWIVLTAPPNTVLQRDAGRGKHTASAYLQMGAAVVELLADRATVIDTRELDVEQTVRLVEDALTALPYQPASREGVWWLVEVTVEPKHVDAFEALTREMAVVARAEIGTTAYRRFRIDDTTFHLYERYATEHAALEHLDMFDRQFSARFTTLVERRRFHVYGRLTPDLQLALDHFGAIVGAPWPD